MSEEETAWAISLSEENRLYLLELLEDMLGELELGTSRPAIKLWNQVIKYPQLHPGDGIQIRQNYMKRRYQMAQLLEQHGIVSNVDVPRGQSGYDVDLLFQGDPAHVRALLASVRASFPRRTKPPSPPSPPFWKRYARRSIFPCDRRSNNAGDCSMVVGVCSAGGAAYCWAAQSLTHPPELERRLEGHC
jgi:hypothetical protein